MATYRRRNTVPDIRLKVAEAQIQKDFAELVERYSSRPGTGKTGELSPVSAEDLASMGGVMSHESAGVLAQRAHDESMQVLSGLNTLPYDRNAKLPVNDLNDRPLDGNGMSLS